MPITPDLFAEGPSENKRITFEVPVHRRDVDWQCRYSMGVPALINRDRGNRKGFNATDLFKFGGGDCYELASPEKKFVSYLSLFNLAVDLDVVVSKEERASILDEAWDFFELRHYKGYYNKRTDKYGWNTRDVTVAEVAGFHKDEFDILPHVPFFDIKRSNYYRILLMGKHTIVLLSVVGPTSASVEELQAQALPILKALRYEAEKPGNK